MVDRITKSSKHIANFPMAGRKVHEFDREEIREIIESSYRIVYKVCPERIDILAVLHGARSFRKAVDGEAWGKELEPEE